ncbi:MAG: hypothetical protein AAFO04_15010 [Cyanobacteria bacterium J06592_8]
MAFTSQPLNPNSSTLVPCDVYSTSETTQPNLAEKYSQLQIEIQELTDAIAQLETASVFQPPHRLMPLEERLELHFQSIKAEKERPKKLKKAQETLACKQEELAKIEPLLKQRQLEATATLKRLKSLAQVVQHSKNAYSQAMEEFQATVQLAHQALIDAYGQQGHFILETEVKPQYLALDESHPQLLPSS